MTQHDLVVIGAGPGGYVAAIRAAQLGMNVACVEQEPDLGGTCLRVGCIPSKALLESSELYARATHDFGKLGIRIGELSLELDTLLQAKNRTVGTLTSGVAALLKKNKVRRYVGHGHFDEQGGITVESTDGPRQLAAKNIIIATGSQPAQLAGVVCDGRRIGTSTDALAYEQVPDHLVVIGAGYIGLELGTVWRRLGAKVTVLEYLDRILPGMDSELARDAYKIFCSQGMSFRLSCRVTGANASDSECHVHIEDGDSIACDRILVAVGRVPNTEGLGLDFAGVNTDGRGFVSVNRQLETTAQGIYAIGDVVGGAMLAHKAEEEGIACVEHMNGQHGHVNYDAIPGVVYTQPEVASVGKSEDQLKSEPVNYRKGTFPFLANGRARTIGQVEGYVKILADAETDRILGVHILGPHAGDLIAEAAVAIEFGASSEDLARCCHAHPTLAEAIKEASLDVANRAIHF